MSDRGLPTLSTDILPVSLHLPWRWRQCVLKSWGPPSRAHSVIIHKTTIWNEHLLLSLVSDTWTDILEFINDILTCITFLAPNDRLQLMYFCDTSDNIRIFFLQNLQARVLSSLPHLTHIHKLSRLHSHKLQCTVKQHGLDQCFSTFVRPRPGKFFFHKMRVRSQQIYLSVPFQFLLSSYIKLT